MLCLSCSPSLCADVFFVTRYVPCSRNVRRCAVCRSRSHLDRFRQHKFALLAALLASKPTQHKTQPLTHGATECALKLAYLQCSFSSRFPRDVTDSARMNSSNSMEPSCGQEWHNSHYKNPLSSEAQNNYA